MTSCFWDVETSGKSNGIGYGTAIGVIGKTSAEMKNITMFLNSGWDFAGETTNGTCNFWMMPQGGGYPIPNAISGNMPYEPVGSGTQESPYQITDVNDLGTIWCRPSAYYILTKDIDLSGSQWGMAVVPIFSGQFNGNGYSVSNLVMRGVHLLGLFGEISANGIVHHTNTENFSVPIISYYYIAGGLAGVNQGSITYCYGKNSIGGDGLDVGGLVGQNFGSVMYSYNIGNISGNGRTGGLIGQNFGTVASCYAIGDCSGDDVGGLVGYNREGTISSCYASGAIIGSSVGGLVGHNDAGSVISCYTAGSVDGGYEVGGLAGYNYQGKILHCYSIGKVTGVFDIGGLCGYVNTGGNYEDTGNFWDIETSEITTSAMGTGKTTAEMKTLATFTNAGWDFGDVWAICEGTNTPRLQWQMPAADWVCPDGVRMEDFAFLAGHWMETTSEADLSGDGVVGMEDLMMFGDQWMAGI